MTKEELENKLAELSRKYEQDKYDTLKSYAEANCDIKVGDIITDHIHTIKVEKIGFHYGYNDPMMVFEGPDYKKDGTISKRQTNTPVYQSNIKFINGKEYQYKE